VRVCCIPLTRIAAHAAPVFAATLFAALFAAPFAAYAATLQIAPVTVEMSADTVATGITLSNPGDTPLYGQVRVFRWDQQQGDDALTPTQDVVASPPLIEIPAHADQLVRLVHAAPRGVGEQNYRLLIDELPPPGTAATNGVTIRLRYSVPVFVEPPGPTGEPQLSWRLVKSGQNWLLRVDNAGTGRAQIATVQLIVPSGRVYEINDGLLGYALAGRSRQWQVPLPADADVGGAVKVRASINTQPAQAPVIVDRGG
jgi:fimbrial chaperone protein